jgi:hypothetical protein
MPDLTFRDFADRKANATLDSLRSSISDALERDVDALRVELNERLARLRSSISNSDQTSLVTRLVEDLVEAGTRETEHAAACARRNAERAADERLAAAAAAVEAQVERERGEVRRVIEAAQTENAATTRAAKAEVETVRATLTAALDQERVTQRALSHALTMAQQETADIHTELNDRTARLEVTARRLQEVEESHLRVQEALTSSEARRASDVQERSALEIALESARHASVVARAEADTQRSEADGLRRTINELHTQVQDATSNARTEVQAVRAQLTAALDEAHEAQLTLSVSLAAAQQDAAVASKSADESKAHIEAAEHRFHTLEETHLQLQQIVADTQAGLAREADHRAAMASALTAAQQATIAARTEAEAHRTELQETRARLASLEQQLVVENADVASLAQLRRSLQAFDGHSHLRDVLETFLGEFGRAFDRVALFAIRQNRLTGWRSRGFEPTTDVRNLIIPLTIESPLTRAASEGRSIMLESAADNPETGLFGHDTSYKVAIPIYFKRRLVAIAYAEIAHRLQAESRGARLQCAEILADRLSESLGRVRRRSRSAPVTESNAREFGDDNREGPVTGHLSPAATRSAYPGPARAVNRVRLPDDVEVLVDGSAGRLVDISGHGAQILCPRAIRPNHQVRMVLPTSGSNALCQGRVVWSLFEMATGIGWYRAGLKFTNVDTNAIDTFVKQQLSHEQRTSA